MKKDLLQQHILNRDWVAMTQLLRGLSNMEFRRMENVVRNEILVKLNNELYWEALLHLIIYKRQAFISGIYSCEHLIKDGSLSLDNEYVNSLHEHLKESNSESLVKMVNMLIPFLQSERQINDAFEAFHIDNEVTRLSLLLKNESQLTYFVVFKTLKMVDDKLIVTKCCKAIMKRNSDMAFNAVSVMKAYFALDDLPARFSLNIPEYELSKLDNNNFEYYAKLLNGKRPIV